MVVVAVVGAVCWGVLMKLRSDRYRSLARKYAADEKATLENIVEFKNDIIPIFRQDISTSAGVEEWTYHRSELEELHLLLDNCKKWAPYYARMRQKYEYAADHPWLSVLPDPPEPE
jgi:hypothetical protein